MTRIADNIGTVRQRIAQACLAAGRPVRSVTLLCVSKTARAAALREAYEAGECHFGENYAQEGCAKIDALADLRSHMTWHMIGPLQANKTRSIAEHFDWVHTIDRIKVARRLSEQRPAGREPLQVCLQVNIGAQPSKSGVAPGEVAALARSVRQLPGLRLRGLMAIAQALPDLAAQRTPHRALRELWEGLNAQGLALDTLSMGMTADLEAAILEGATLIRVGTAIFGEREQAHPSPRPDADPG
ncbi:MAG: YggS family pyridoxal phosphate-dependent enzyme [Burkholderiaceae bacterium]